MVTVRIGFGFLVRFRFRHSVVVWGKRLGNALCQWVSSLRCIYKDVCVGQCDELSVSQRQS